MSEIDDLYENFNFGKDQDEEDPENAIINNQQVILSAMMKLETQIEKLNQDLIQMVARFYHVFPDYGTPSIKDMMAERYKPRFEEREKNNTEDLFKKPSSAPKADPDLEPL